MLKNKLFKFIQKVILHSVACHVTANHLCSKQPISHLCFNVLDLLSYCHIPHTVGQCTECGHEGKVKLAGGETLPVVETPQQID